ncbi:hypothetical protein A0O28_0072460 [Trichoderma guizhouense]|uniref:Uncharacterized protein n=1 Tax=Trichoderma guizhouense TaxID=1491466 RepID=A0A1T3D1A8_9HYPO|nr:hypothetical protein A0O28_0072460 [Trichoderma guizhouense]
MKPVFGVVGDEAIPRRIMKDCVGTEGGYRLSLEQLSKLIQLATLGKRYPEAHLWTLDIPGRELEFKRLKEEEHNAEEARKAAEEKRRGDKEYRDEVEFRRSHQRMEGFVKHMRKSLELKRLKKEAHEAAEKYKKAEADRIAREKGDFPQLATLPSPNFKRAGSGSRSTPQPHKARGITEVWNRNTISKDSTQTNELCAPELRNRDTISKDLTQSDGPFKAEMQNRGAISKNKIENDKARITGAMQPNGSPGLYAVHQLSPAQQQQQQQMVAAALQNGTFNGINSTDMDPQQQQQMIQLIQGYIMLQWLEQQEQKNGIIDPQQQQQQEQWTQQSIQRMAAEYAWWSDASDDTTDAGSDTANGPNGPDEWTARKHDDQW